MLPRRALSIRAGFPGPLLVLAAVVGAQEPVAPAAPAAPVVTIAGASVSAGFQDLVTSERSERDATMKLQFALRSWWPRGEVRVRDRSDPLLFLDPAERGARQIERARRDEPALLIGIDLPFWFGYGHVRGSDRKQARLARQREGLALLETLDCPMILGDYPDMTGAHPRMLAPAQIPTADELAALNAALRAWADQRGKVAIFPLANWVAEVKAKGATVQLGDRTVSLTTAHLMQGDGLHATRLGVALLAHRVCESVADVLGDDHPLRRARIPLEVFLQRTGTEVDLPAGQPDRAKRETAR
jgi:hypothetical protein